MTNNRETQTQSSHLSCCSRICLAKAIKDERQEIAFYANARILNSKFDIRVYLFQLNLDQPSLWSVFDRVGKQIPDNLLQAIGVAKHWPGAWINKQLQSDFLCL